MLIENKLKRRGGSFVDMGDGTTYHFKDDGTGREVASVTNPAHIQRLLSIPEGYRIPEDQLAAMAAQQPVGAVYLAEPKAPGTPPPAVTTVAVTPPPAVLQNTDGAGESDKPASGAAEEGQGGADQTGASETGLVELTADTPIETIRQVYRDEIGREPNANYKAATLIAQIEAARKAKS